MEPGRTAGQNKHAEWPGACVVAATRRVGLKKGPPPANWGGVERIFS